MGGHRREGDLLTGDRVDHVQLRPVVGGDQPAIGGANQIPAAADRRLREREPVDPVLCEVVEAGNVVSVGFRGVEEAWRLWPMVAPMAEQAGVRSVPHGAYGAGTQQVRDF